MLTGPYHEFGPRGQRDGWHSDPSGHVTLARGDESQQYPRMDGIGMKYLQKGNSQSLARKSGDVYESYSYTRGRWEHTERMQQSEIIFTGEWYDITEEEAAEVIADVASGAFYSDSYVTKASGGCRVASTATCEAADGG